MTNITGRDTYIICKALAYAILTIERLPTQWQEWSDCQDMKAILEATISDPDMVQMFMVEARGHVERRGVKVVDGQLAVGDREDNTVVKFPED